MQLTRNFSLDELVRSETASARGVDNTPPDDVRSNLRMTALGLEQIRSMLGGRPVHVSSGYRCPALNQAIGGTTGSAHLTGFAADIFVPTMSAFGLAQAIRDSRLAFDQLILETGRNVVHVGFAPALRGLVLTQAKGPGTPLVLGLVA